MTKQIFSEKARKSLKRTASLLFVFVFMISFAFPLAVNAEVSGQVLADPEIKSPYAVIQNVDNGQIIFEKEADTKIAPASTVKLMVALVTYEKLVDNSEDLNKTYAASSTAVKNITGNNIGIRENEEFKLKDLLAGVLVSCANDACNVAAEAASGSISQFVKDMNKKAAELGMTNTNYTNTSGIDDKDMYTTASDVAKLAAAVYKVNDLAEIADTDKYIIPATNKSTNQRNLLNKNHLVSTYTTTKYNYDSAIGLNAGFTDDGGHCVVTASEKSELQYVYVLMGWHGPSKSFNEDKIEPYLEAKELIKWTHETFKTKEISAELLGSIKVNMGSSADTVVVRLDSSFDFIYDSRKDPEITYVTSIDLSDESFALEAPVEANMVVGTVDIIINGKYFKTLDLVTMTSVSRDEFGYIMGNIGDFFKSKMLKTIIIVFLVLIGLYLLLSITLKILNLVKKYKRKQEKKQRALERRELEEKGLAPPSTRRRRYDDDDDDDDDDEFDY